MSGLNPNSNLDRLEVALSAWEQVKQGGASVNGEEITKLISNISECGKAVFKEYSHKGQLEAVSPILALMKQNFSEIRVLLESHLKGRVNLTAKGVLFDNIKLKDLDKIGTKSLLHILKDAEKDVRIIEKDMQTYEVVVEHFTKESGVSEKLSHMFEKFIRSLFKSISGKVSSKVYAGYCPPEKFNHKKNQLNRLVENQNNLKQKIEEKKQELENIFAMKINLESMKESPKQLQLLVKLAKNEEKITKNIKYIERELTELSPKIAKLTEEIDSLEQDINLGKRARTDLHAIGGESIKIELSGEKTNLDGVYLSCNTFRQTLQDAGAQMYVLSYSFPDEQADKSGKEKKVVTSRGIAMPKVANHQAIRALESLGVFRKGDKGAGWTKVETDQYILYVPDEEAERLKKANFLSDTMKLSSGSSAPEVQIEELDTTKPTNGGTVLLTTGNGGVYEEHKREMVAFLLRGMNVMAFNFRGYGQSTGVPSQEGIKRDMEAAYDYLKAKHHVQDNRIMVKALCMSGGPATHLAAKHPHVNLFLDQTYADFSELVETGVHLFIDEYVNEKNLELSVPGIKAILQSWALKNGKRIASALVKLISPAWSVRKEIGKVKGHVGFLLTSSDETMKLDRDIYQNFKAIVTAQEASSISVYQMEGTHGESWLKPHRIDTTVVVATSPKMEKIIQGNIQKKAEHLSMEHPSLSKEALLRAYEGFRTFPGDETDDKPVDAILARYIDPSIKDPKLRGVVRDFLRESERNYYLCKGKFSLITKLRDQLNAQGNELTETDVSAFVDRQPEEIRKLLTKFFEQAIKFREPKTPSVVVAEQEKVMELMQQEATKEAQELVDQNLDQLTDEFVQLPQQFATALCEAARSDPRLHPDSIKSQLKALLDEHLDPNLTEISDLSLRKAVRECVAESALRFYWCDWCFNKLMQEKESLVEQGKEISEKNVQNLIESQPAHLQDFLRDFFSKTITFNVEEEAPPLVVGYDGRMQMDMFLDKAKLRGTFP